MSGDRRRWRNHTGNQECTPRSIEHPASLDELVALVRRAEDEGTTVRAVGAHHSWSDVALTEGLLLEPGAMSGLQPLDDGCLRAGVDPGTHARVLGGTSLRVLNPALHDAAQALANMGGYDAQTIAGVISTSTHGSGLAFGPFCDAVRSLDLVIAGGEVVRVEPADGPTDPAAFARVHGGDRALVQNDERFAAAACGMGCLGLIASLVIGVRERFFLNETRTVTTWEAIRDELAVEQLERHEHYELFLSPYARRDGAHSVLVTTRTAHHDPADLPQDKRERHPLTEMASAFPGTWLAVRAAARLAPGLLASRFEWLLRSMADDGYAGRSYEVFNIGEANKVPAYSSELGVTLEGGRHVEAVDRILRIAAERRRSERLIHTSPIALRFVAPSRASASMMHGRPTMMIELIMAKGTRRGYDLLDVYERELADLEVRPHWGQHNRLSAASDLHVLYPEWERWLRVYREHNASGVFDSPFTDRLGISVRS